MGKKRKSPPALSPFAAASSASQSANSSPRNIIDENFAEEQPLASSSSSSSSPMALANATAYEGHEVFRRPTLVNRRERSRAASHSSHASSRADSKVELLVDQPASSKWKNFILRGTATIFMIGAFFAIFACGPLAVICLVVAVQTGVYKEVIYLAHVPSKEKKLPWSRSLNWYFLISTNYFLYGSTIIHYFKSFVVADTILLPLSAHHRFISFVLYCIGFVMFVANLKKGHYKFQFIQFAWTHMTLLMVIFTSHFIINNMFEGMFWVFLPVSLVICNDIFAYICGFFWGRTPLIKLSPKKTWEGFVGAWICTVVFGFVWTHVFTKYNFMICPVKDLTVTAWTGVQCVPNAVFIPRQFELAPPFATIIRRLFSMHVRYIYIAPVHFHVMVFSCFASLIAPFGGFFASGFKRAFKIKDFADTIPGHGGLTDRMDCQFLMGLFSAMYHTSFIRVASAVTVGGVLELAVGGGLSTEEIVELYRRLQMYVLERRLVRWDDLGGMPDEAIDWTKF